MQPSRADKGGMITSAVSRTAIVCADNELLRFEPTDGQTCEAYMAPYISQAGGYLIDPAAGAACEYCTLSTTDQFLQGAFGLDFSHAYVKTSFTYAADDPGGETSVSGGCTLLLTSLAQPSSTGTSEFPRNPRRKHGHNIFRTALMFLFFIAWS
jgi:hypothetical protein